MKSLRASLATGVLALLALVSPVSANIIISELCDPRLNFQADRFIEIYNAGSAPVDLAGWSLIAVGNGGDIFTWTLSGTIQPGDALVAGDQTTIVAFPVDFPDEAWSSSNGLWNGKVGDGARLLDNGVLVDYAVVGSTLFENRDYVRNFPVITPSTTFNASEWTGTFVDFPNQGTPGTHSAAPPPAAPTILDVRRDPVVPLAGETVDIVADVTDDTWTITSVEAHWGTAPGALTNTISMSLESGFTYRTDSSIPGQAGGVTVYYEVEATNDAPATTTSQVSNYELAPTVSIFDIQGQTSSSTYDGQAVVTQGVVTASYGSFFTLQDGAGSWNGLWCSGGGVAVGDLLSVRGTVTESFGGGFDGTTMLEDVLVLSTSAGSLPGSTLINTATSVTEAYEGVLVRLLNASCTDADLGQNEWAIDDGSGASRVGALGYDANPTLGTRYDVRGPVVYADGFFQVEPRDVSDVTAVGDTFAPVIVDVLGTNTTTVLVTFSEDLDPTTAETAGNYSIPGLTVSAAAQTAPDQVELTVSTMSETTYTLTVNGVEDLFGNAMSNVAAIFTFVDYGPPAGYYDPAAGLMGEPLQAALHQIIDAHTVFSYDFAWTAFQTTDDKPNGKVWDMYSDVPGGPLPYEYTFGVDQGGDGGAEGNGYNREHSWPRGWFGDLSPMNSDLFALYPTDNFVNNIRGSLPYGEVSVPDFTSLNGSKRGPNTYPGYGGQVFEPIDEYKGDLARTYFYMATRYYMEDAGWPGSAMTSGAQLLPWALDMMLEWHADDPVSWKEVVRNDTVFGFQQNRNPFIDHPEFVAAIFDVVSDVDQPVPARVALHQNWPNPFNPSTVIRYQVDQGVPVRLRVFDAGGRLVSVLRDGVAEEGGLQESIWNGLDQSGRRVASGVYFYRLESEGSLRTRRMTLIK